MSARTDAPTESRPGGTLGGKRGEPTRAPSQADARRGIRRLLPLIGLLSAQGLSLAGNAITMIVVPLYVLYDTGSVLLTGVAGVFATVPVIVGGALGGVLVDRVGFRRAGIIADLASGATVLAIPILAATTGLPFWGLLALVFLSGLLDTPGDTAKTSLLPDLVETSGVRMSRATGAQSAISRSAMMVGASVAAVAVVWLGPLNAMLLDAATFAVSAALLWAFVPRSSVPQATDAAASSDSPVTAVETPDGTIPVDTVPVDTVPAGFWRELADGIRFMVSKPLIRNAVLMIVITNSFDAAAMTVLKPVYARTISPDGALFGVMVAFFAFGALTGAALYGWFGHRLPRRATLVVCFFLAGPPPYFAMAFDLPVPLLLTVFAVAGLSAGSINPLLSVVLYEQIPRGMRARVLGALTTGVSAGMPIGSFFGGLAVAQAGLVPTLLVVGTTYAIVSLAPLTGGSWRELDAPRGSAAVPEPVAA
ncbi:MFS transporter [Glaciibacter superstes]|uniref:MFS transporter n=1 Tax=Glaciibacter superstes TaxID=501023 RepID=UPI0003B6C53C|nr:MFS transporter [Glaciibacter superstes]